MKNERCPPQDDLSAFVRCQVSEEQSEAISEHVANCPQCEETVVGLEKGADTFFDRLKGIPASFPFQDEPELARMVQAVKQRPPETNAEKSDSPPLVAMLEQLRDYRILEKIGEGGMGAVYRAMHTRLNKIVAIKVLSTSRLKDESAISRFQREMSIVGRLQHPNIVQAHDAGEEAGQHFLVMEYVEGTDLSEIVRRRGPLPVNAACEIIAQAALGLQYAHENGLVHRDIKPSNLMLSVSSDKRTNEVIAAVVKILDLGLARLHTDDKQNGPELTTDGQIMGTLDYMAPEQGGDSHAVDIRADIYSLGATLYKLLTGEALFGGERHRSVIQKLTALATEPAPSVRGRRPEVPEPLAAIIARMVSKQPQDRFATPAEVASALQPFRSSAELPALLGLSSRLSEALPLGSTVQLASNMQPPKRRTPLARAAKWFFGAAAMFAIILTITTKQGTIEVESPDGKLPDDVRVVVSRGGDGVEVLQADNQWRASVAGGKVQLTVQGGDDRFELQDSTLTVSRFGKSVVTLRVKQAAGANVVAKQQEVTATNPDRRAAEYLLSIGCSFDIKENGQGRSISALRDLPRGAFELMWVEIQSNPKVNDAGLANFQGCKNLKHLHLNDCANTTDAGLVHFKDCENLAYLALGLADLGDAGLAHFKDCKNLTSVLLHGSSQVTDLGLAHFKDGRDLTLLSLHGCSKVSDAGLAHFKDRKNLTYLDLTGTKVTDAGLVNFQNCKYLLRLELNSTNVSDAGLANFKDCKNLDRIDLGSTKVIDAGLAHFQQCTNLTWLNLGETNVTDSGLAQLKNCKRVSFLTLQNSAQISDTGLVHIQDWKDLALLDLTGSKVTDAGLDHLADFQNLGLLVIRVTKVTETGVKKLSAALPGCKIQWDGGVIEPQGKVPSRPNGHETVPDRALPFVRVSPTGEVRGEYRFANEALVILQGDDILEVHGNGPFKVGQITRRDMPLQIRAGKGYRPRFVVGFEIPASAFAFGSGTVEWFRLDNVTLSIEGCDFIGGSCWSFCSFSGVGGSWTFENCRLTQPASSTGSLLSFQGDSLLVRNSLLFNWMGTAGPIANLWDAKHICIEQSVMFGRGTAMAVNAKNPNQIVLNNNVFYHVPLIEAHNTSQTGKHPVIEARDNLIVQSAMLRSFAELGLLPKPNVTWKGHGNRYLPMEKASLWERPIPQGDAASRFATVAEWNEHWKNPDDLKQIDSIRFAWDLFDQADWTAGRARFAEEISAARKRFPDLAQLGPETALVGSGAAHDAVLRAAQPGLEMRPAALEGGPFVLIRDDKPLEGHVSLLNALPHAKDGDVIEIRSDGAFPACVIHQPYSTRLTVRAGAGYRPSFAQFVSNSAAGDWTLEGLHFSGKVGEASLACRARRIANCSVDASANDDHSHTIYITGSGGAKQPTEIVNCYFPHVLRLGSSKARVENSVVRAIETVSEGEWSLDMVRSCLWSHSSPQQRSGTSMALWNVQKNGRVRCSDCLIDAEVLNHSVDLPWQGERNLYRFSQGLMPSISTGKDNWKTIFTLADWQKHWNSDLDSREDDSVVLRPEMWRRR